MKLRGPTSIPETPKADKPKAPALQADKALAPKSYDVPSSCNQTIEKRAKRCQRIERPRELQPRRVTVAPDNADADADSSTEETEDQ